MKINGFYSSLSRENNQVNSVCDADFELWIKTPTKQSSGDEFYWQHQNQLQTSNLTFNGLAKKEAYNPPESVSSKSSASGELNSEASSTEQIITAPQTLKNNREVLFQNKMPHIESCYQGQKYKLDLIPQPSGLTVPKISEKIPLLSTLASSNLQIIDNNPPKDYHLFIEEQEADLMMNTQDLTSKDTQEILQTLKMYFKQKGLLLKQLLINGVNHD